jgi:hypothetical protein
MIETVKELVTKYLVDGVAFSNIGEAEGRLRANNAKKIVQGLSTVASRSRWYLVRDKTQLEAVHLMLSGGQHNGGSYPSAFFPAWINVQVWYSEEYGWTAKIEDLSVEMLEEMVELI